MADSPSIAKTKKILSPRTSPPIKYSEEAKPPEIDFDIDPNTPGPGDTANKNIPNAYGARSA